MNLCWLDLETTGIEPDLHHLLEVAVIITDPSLKVLGSRQFVLHAHETQLSKMAQVVQDMHIASGLVEDVQASTKRLEWVDAALNVFLEKHVSLDEKGNLGKLIPAGRNVGSFDVPWARKHLPLSAQRLHYRTYDVTTMQLVAEGRGKTYDKPPSNHRAMTDLIQDLAFADWFTSVMLV